MGGGGGCGGGGWVTYQRQWENGVPVIDGEEFKGVGGVGFQGRKTYIGLH